MIISIIPLFTGTIIFIVMNYYIGVVVMSLPTLGRMRSTGFAMVQDSLLTFTLLAFLMGFMLIWNGIMNMVFPTYEWFGLVQVFNPFAANQGYVNAENWMSAQRLEAMELGALINSLSIAFSSLDKVSVIAGLSIGSSFARIIDAIASPWSTMVTMYIELLSGLKLWVEFIGPPGNFWAVLFVVGAFIYSIPGRIGRRAGAWLIATPMSFIVALPFMPGFVESFTQSIYDSMTESLKSGVWSFAMQTIFKWPPSFDPTTVNFNQLLDLLFSLANPATWVVVRLMLTSLYILFIFALSRSLAGMLATSSVPSLGSEFQP